MRILFLAPEPFFQERGTPIAVRLALQVLAERPEAQVDLVTYHEGEEVDIPGVTIHRTAPPPWIPMAWLTGVGAGISFKKLACDVLFVLTVFRMLRKRRHLAYDLIHAVEESVFIALLAKWLYGIPYIYDMDSALALQVTEKWPIFRPLAPLLSLFERVAIRQSNAVVPVCDALALFAHQHGARDTHILRDVSLLELSATPPQVSQLRAELKIPASASLCLYIGNLESYQGIDLMVTAFARAAHVSPKGAVLVIIGGTRKLIERFRALATSLGVESAVHFIGPRPVSSLSSYLAQADLLLSPRTKGSNTPMKIYSYLHSGIPIVATRLATHTQVLSDAQAFLGAPNVEGYAEALLAALKDPLERNRRGNAAKKLAEEQYTFEVFRSRLHALYDKLTAQHRNPPASKKSKPEEDSAAA